MQCSDNHLCDNLIYLRAYIRARVRACVRARARNISRRYLKISKERGDSLPLDSRVISINPPNPTYMFDQRDAMRCTHARTRVASPFIAFPRSPIARTRSRISEILSDRVERSDDAFSSCTRDHGTPLRIDRSITFFPLSFTLSARAIA
jgi:hypothetical protein